jgi:two-component system, OmpR family, sensor histidine kinase KdpD
MAGASSTLADRGERMKPEERQALARSVFLQCREMSERVSKVLQMTRLEAGGIELRRDWAALGEIVASVLRSLQEPLAAHHVHVEIPADLPLVRIDAALIEQVLVNLMENAARYTPGGTVVRLRAAAVGAELVVSVEDYGPGVADEDPERVFAKFQHGTLAGASGMGLGLAISRAIVGLHRGRAWAERIEGGGMAFRFSLPLEAAPPVPAEAEA